MHGFPFSNTHSHSHASLGFPLALSRRFCAFHSANFARTGHRVVWIAEPHAQAGAISAPFLYRLWTKKTFSQRVWLSTTTRSRPPPPSGCGAPSTRGRNCALLSRILSAFFQSSRVYTQRAHIRKRSTAKAAALERWNRLRERRENWRERWQGSAAPPRVARPHGVTHVVAGVCLRMEKGAKRERDR